MITRLVCIRNKDCFSKNKDRKEKVRKNLKDRKTNVMGRQEPTTDEKSNLWNITPINYKRQTIRVVNTV